MSLAQEGAEDQIQENPSGEPLMSLAHERTEDQIQRDFAEGMRARLDKHVGRKPPLEENTARFNVAYVENLLRVRSSFLANVRLINTLFASEGPDNAQIEAWQEEARDFHDHFWRNFELAGADPLGFMASLRKINREVADALWKVQIQGLIPLGEHNLKDVIFDQAWNLMSIWMAIYRCELFNELMGPEGGLIPQLKTFFQVYFSLREEIYSFMK